jgi:hypothetical protein
MRHSIAVPAALVIAVVAVVAVVAAGLPALAQEDSSRWKRVETADCAVKDHGILRCLLAGAKYPTGTLTIRNSHESQVTFTWEEWHSTCGFAGGKVETRTLELGGKETKVFNLVSPGAGITCREVFLVDCKVGGAATGCPEVLVATGQMYTGNQQ